MIHTALHFVKLSHFRSKQSFRSNSFCFHLYTKLFAASTCPFRYAHTSTYWEQTQTAIIYIQKVPSIKQNQNWQITIFQ